MVEKKQELRTKNQRVVKLTAILVSYFFILSYELKAQFYNLPNEYSSSLITEKKLSEKDSSIHSGIKPYIHFFSDKYINQPDTHRLFKYIIEDPALDLAFYKHIITVQPHGQNYKFILDPILNVDLGKDYYNGGDSGFTTTNTRGFIGSGYVGNKVYFETMFAESQSDFPIYLSNTVRGIAVVPGQGRWKTFKKTGFDYAFSSGFVSYQAFKNLNIQFGHGKQKIGNGYRSLLLSDNSFNYPYARFTQQWFKGRLQYSNIYAVLMNLDSASKTPIPNAERLFQKKAAAFQYLSINVTKFLNIGLFQGMIWQAGDNKNRQHLGWQYFNPVIYTNLPQYGLTNNNNILIGSDLKFKLTNKINVYAQFMADDLNNSDTLLNGFGYQAGACYNDAFGLRNLFLQAEYNNVSEGSYRNPLSATASNQSYSHYNQGLAYTPGYGNEIMLMAEYKYKRLFINAKYHYQVVPKGDEYFYHTTIGTAKIGYLINPSYNLNLIGGFTYRNQNFPNFKLSDNQTNYIFVGIRTSLYNFYYDF